MISTKIKRKLILTVVILNIIGTTNILFTLNLLITEKTNNINYIELKSSAIWTASPIFVEDDNPARDWAHFVSSFPWCFGSGTELDPFIIENVSISGGAADCIRIRDSVAHFKIRNCNLTNGNKGIFIENADNGQLINNNCSSNTSSGIDIDYSDNLTIIDNILVDNYGGISPGYSDNLFINGNDVSDNNYGINLYYCDYNVVSYNLANDNSDFGIRFYSNINSTILNNTANRNGNEGIYVGGLDGGNNVNSNFLDGNEIGISIESSSDNTIFNNTAQNSVSSGIYVGGGSNKVTGNLLQENQFGITVDGSYKTVEQNTIINNNARGVNLVGSYNNLDKNIINYNGHGIYITGFYANRIRNNISNNIISHNVNHGIGLYYDCHNNTIFNNEISHNGGSGFLGDQFGNFMYNVIAENLIYDNSWSGLDLLEFSYNYVVGNNITGNHNAGLLIFDDCDWNTISDNYIYDNFQSGIDFNQNSFYNIVNNNTIYRNRNRGVLLSTGVNNFTNNLIEDNFNYGVLAEVNANGNTFSGNYFIGNGINANDAGTNFWNNSLIGNYWDEYESPFLDNIDINDDGIGEIPYNITEVPLVQDFLPIFEDGDDIAPPIISVVNPIEYQITGIESPNFQISIVGLYTHTKWYELVGSSQNKTFTDDISQIDQSLWTGFGNGTVKIRFFVNDTLGYGTMDEIIIRKDIFAPIMIVNSPTSDSLHDDIAPTFNVEITDPNLDEMWYTIDGGLNNYTFTTNTSINQGAWDLASDGLVIIEFYASDTGKNIISDSIMTRKDTVAPVVNILTPNLSDLFGKSTIAFNVEIFDLNLEIMWYSIQGVSMNITFTMNGTINQALWESVGSGVITLIFYANDTHGRQTSDSVTISKDSDAPSLSILDPDSSEIFYVSPPQFEISVSDPNLELVWYTIDGGITNITLYDYIGPIDDTEWASASIGDVTITFYARDTLGNIASEEVTVEKRSVSPPPPPPAIHGYSYIILLGIVATISLVLIKNIKKKI